MSRASFLSVDIWSKVLSESTTELTDSTGQPQAADKHDPKLVDLDGDGANEILAFFGFTQDGRLTTSQEIRCYSSGGEALDISPQRESRVWRRNV